MTSSAERMLANNPFGGKSARACDNCVMKRARWYCAADDAFLCQSCDSSVHSANPLARRHERVRLKVGWDHNKPFLDEISGPSWHQGFTKKARTPRQKKYIKPEFELLPLHDLVPELGSEENSHEENEDQLLCRVPIFDPFAEELCTPNEAVNENKSKDMLMDYGQEMHEFQGFLSSELDLSDFAADVESLLGKGLEDETFDIEELGFLSCEKEEDCKDDIVMKQFGNRNYQTDDTKKIKKKEIMLRLDYDGVLSAWDGQRSPWTTGERPEFDSDDYWPTSMETSGAMHMGMKTGHAALRSLDEGREARVSRYREKRRTRLFSKKIRYEVRKLNAEKRPRMKGRFVKRTNFVAASSFPLL